MKITKINQINTIQRQNKVNFTSKPQEENKTPESFVYVDVNKFIAAAKAGIINTMVYKNAPDEVKEILEDAQRAQRKTNITLKKIQNQALAKQKEVLAAKLEASEKYKEVSELFSKGEEITPDGKVLRKITQKNNGRTNMEEFDENGKLLRSSYFKNGKLANFREGEEELDDGTLITAKDYAYCDGVPSWYGEGYIDYPEDSSKAKKHIYFSNDDTYWIEEDCDYNIDGNIKVARMYDFANNKLTEYQQNKIQTPADNDSVELEAVFEDGKPMYCREGRKSGFNGEEKTARCINYYRGKIDSYEEDIEGQSEFETAVGTKITYENDVPVCIMLGYDAEDDSVEKMYELTKAGWEESDY